MTDSEKTSKLIELIDILCTTKFQNASNIIEWIAILEKIYANDYRHSYSDIFNKLQTIFTQDFEKGVILGENLNAFNSSIQAKLREDNSDANLLNASKGFRKFSDHINLEIGRYNFIKNQFSEMQRNTIPNAGEVVADSTNIYNKINKVSDAVDKIRYVTEQAKKELEKIDPKLEKVDDKLKSNTISSITALTIFSAVILAFSGGFTFEASVFNGIASVSAYRLIFIVALTGFILFNTIFALLYLIGKMTEKTIGTQCKYLSSDKSSISYRNCGDGVCTKPLSSVSVGCKILQKYFYVFAVNVTLLWVMYADFILWLNRTQMFHFIIVLYIALPVLLIPFLFVISFINKKVQKHRILLQAKINLISKYLNPEDDNDTANFFNSLMTTITLSLSGRAKRNILVDFTEMLKEQKGHISQFKKILRRVDSFIEEKVITENTLINTITYYSHKQNKKKWEMLKSRFRERLVTDHIVFTFTL